MKILSAIISSIWNTITFMDKEQRALVAHVLTVSQAHPKSFNYRNQTGRWESKGLKITFDEAHKEVFLSEVKYQLGWRANAILARHFAMLHICLHHEHIGKALSEIDSSENEPKKKVNAYDNQQTVGDIESPTSSSIITNFKREFAKRDVVRNTVQEPIDLLKHVGKNCYVELSDGETGKCYVNYLQGHDAVQLFSSITLFNRFGKDLHSDLHVTTIRELEGSFRDVIKTDFVVDQEVGSESLDLTQYIGKTVVATKRDGVKRTGLITKRAENEYLDVLFDGWSFYKNGSFWGGSRESAIDIISVEEIEHLKPPKEDLIAKIKSEHPKKERQPEWTTDIDLTKWIGKTVDVRMRNGDDRNRVKIDSRESLTWNISIAHTPYTQEGRYYDKGADGRDIVAIRPSVRPST